MRQIIIGDSSRIIPYVDSVIGGDERFSPDCMCFGILDADGEIEGGCVFTSYDGAGVVLHSAGSSPAWLNRTFLRVVFSYPFKQLGCRRLTTMVREDNKHAQQIALKAGFKYEGLLRAAEPDGCGLLVYGMLIDECRWIKDRPNGKEKFIEFSAA